MQQHGAHFDDSSSNSAKVWLHSAQQPVTDDELNALLTSKPWKVKLTMMMR